MHKFRKKIAAWLIGMMAGMMIWTGTAWAYEPIGLQAVLQTVRQVNNEEIGPGVGRWREELNRKAEILKEEKEAARKQESGPGMEAGGEAEDKNDAETRTIDPNRPMVALTIDDGPYAPVGNRILDCLAEHGAKATFYMVGNRCANYVEEMKRIAADGHELGNHTYSHKYLVNLGAEGIRREIDRGSEAIRNTSGTAPATVRLPGGLKNETVLANVHAPMIGWSIDTQDWKTKNAQSTVSEVLNKVQDGDIILLHELYGATADALVQVIPALIERGYQLVTVSELASYRGGMENGKIYHHFRPQTES